MINSEEKSELVMAVKWAINRELDVPLLVLWSSL